MKKPRYLFIMALILASGFSLSGCRNRTAEGAKPEAAAESAPSTITLTAEAVKTAGIEIAEAGFRPVIRKIQAMGELMFNPKRLAHMTAKASGRIEQLLAYQGDKIQKGQTLLTLYSQDFLTLQGELLQALEQTKRSGAEPAERTTAEALLNSVRNRLRLLDVTDGELAEIEKSGLVRTMLEVRAPITGNIIESLVNSGDFVEFGVKLFRIVDLSTVWADIHIFEKDLASVGPGSEAVIRLGAYPARELKGRLFQIGNVVDEKTRTVEGRIELANPDGRLKPGMYLEADLLSAADTAALFVPGGAVLDLQNKKIVFVRTAPNTFAPRDVEIGLALDGYVEIVKGLKSGESVVVRGSFFLKSELLKKSFGEDRP
jgi:Cu(I)/Ag(I) efflux system membrane fusion protein